MKRLYLVIMLAMLATSAAASIQNDVDSLISKIEQSSCTFYRNGKAYTPTEAAEHIKNKWDYAQDEVKDIETFINEVASKSWFTGKPYMVECGTQQITSQQWLLHLAKSETTQ
ncbi:DUF5329 domain-containing protein [Vibrio tubiashii]|uniref:Membrane protein n=1 Tax=Vibrio tubiashii ATCC 19109 TaxID=1051646 RepID=F9TBL2_9VIBR|nr:DUF5329 family protein [Vibrio tubiashii]AIW13198.1 membrane protein [Vibrio tubiashii ATCC 19109]EGU48730.1 hypothetical protein VITU9109_21934 [Vibrio tubiashii ATCC 19109]